MSWWRHIFFGGKRESDLNKMEQMLCRFRGLLQKNNRVLELISTADEMMGGDFIFDRQYLFWLVDELEAAVRKAVFDLNVITGHRYPALPEVLARITVGVQATLEGREVVPPTDLVLPLKSLGADMADVVGVKMARLGELRRSLDCQVPAGFAVSAYACQRLLEQCGVQRAISAMFHDRGPYDEGQLVEKGAKLQALVLDSTLPRDLARALRKAAARLKTKDGLRLAVRSSALGEDREMTYAGQYETVLDVPPAELPQAYLRVVASLFSPQVMHYRQAHGCHPAWELMAVGCLRMVDPRAAGVLYTRDPLAPRGDHVLVSATPGLGRAVVDGSRSVDRFEVSREPPHTVRWHALAASDSGPCLNSEEVAELAGLGMRVEQAQRVPQDLEWAVDAKGKVWLLQARPLGIKPDAPGEAEDLSEVLKRYPVAIADRGEVACRGVGSGPVHLVGDDEEVGDLPPGCVLVAQTSRPKLSTALATAAAVLTDLGTTTGHLATIAREYGVPAIMDVQTASDVLSEGEVVTVDAEDKVVYRGEVSELLQFRATGRDDYPNAPEFRLLAALLRKVAPLNLKDPQATSFTPENCRTYHDVIRFAHEKAVVFLAEGARIRSARGLPGGRRLALSIPLDLIVLDLGGGLDARTSAGSVTMGEVCSRPLKALLDGLTVEGAWATEPADMDLRGFMSSATRSLSLTGPGAVEVQPNLAIVTDAYLHLSLHLGYHFTIVDSYLSGQRNDHYIYFRFVGGVTEMARRKRRVELVRRVLEANDFLVESKGDLIIGRIKKISTEAMTERMRMVGRLIGFTRQLDILLRDEALVQHLASTFLSGSVNPSGG